MAVLAAFLHDFGAVKDVPAWVQAIGSILAIVTAMAIGFGQEWARRQSNLREQRSRARNLAIAIGPEIAFLQIKVQSIKRVLDNIVRQVGQKTAISPKAPLLDKVHITVPPILQGSASILYILDSPASHNVQQVLSLINRMNISIMEVRNLEGTHFVAGEFSRNCEEILTLLDKSLSALKPLSIGRFPLQH